MPWDKRNIAKEGKILLHAEIPGFKMHKEILLLLNKEKTHFVVALMDEDDEFPTPVFIDQHISCEELQVFAEVPRFEIAIGGMPMILSDHEKRKIRAFFNE